MRIHIYIRTFGSDSDTTHIRTNPIGEKQYNPSYDVLCCLRIALGVSHNGKPLDLTSNLEGIAFIQVLIAAIAKDSVIIMTFLGLNERNLYLAIIGCLQVRNMSMGFIKFAGIIGSTDAIGVVTYMVVGSDDDGIGTIVVSIFIGALVSLDRVWFKYLADEGFGVLSSIDENNSRFVIVWVSKWQ
ncbi:hypothetical protein BDA99DRAFT_536798 [Phascolomyces articulosus]|uniref:Uncharacterized protein n=1 Tax=Phascolomyces articulosus TaxID=60185 RepID=A0AAD5PE51_9FUNG|nr:hypothetical protein BDA99DRAFT_536798 [Phascolomyces articulosus]